MKRCPECRRDYYDDTLLYCLDDGNALLEGPRAQLGVPPSGGSSLDEPQTAILSEPPASTGGQSVGENPTRPFIHTTAAEAEPQESLGGLPEKHSFSADRAARPQEAEAGDREERGKVGKSQGLLAVFGIVGLLLVGGFFAYRYFTPTKQIESIAVMPFVNESGSADVEYLSDGMTETLIRSLSQLPGLNVKSRSSVFRYKGKDADAKTIGKELGVQAILNGHVEQRGDQLILNLELIDPQTENVIWTDEYNRKQSDLVSLQNEIARDVSTKLKLKLSGTDQQKLTKNYTDDSEAYRLYLQGRFYWNKRAGREFAKAENYFQQAVAKDPNFALGYVGLADTNEDKDRPKKKEYILHALALDDQLPEAHASLGYQYMLDYDWASSERELNRAIELNPNNPQAHAWNGARLMMLGRYDEAMASIKRSLEIDPTAAGTNFYYGILLFVSGKTDESIRQLNKLAEMEPTLPWTHGWLSNAYRYQGDLPGAVEERAKSIEIAGRPDDARLVRASFAKDGWTGYLREMAQQQIANPGQSQTTPAIFLAEIGEKDEALAHLEKGAEIGDFWLFMIKFDPAFDSLRGNPRFQALVKKFDPSE